MLGLTFPVYNYVFQSRTANKSHESQGYQRHTDSYPLKFPTILCAPTNLLTTPLMTCESEEDPTDASTCVLYQRWTYLRPGWLEWAIGIGLQNAG